MKGSKAIVGVFTYLDDALGAVSAAKEGDYEYTVYAPTYLPEIDEATSDDRSPIAIVSITGALLGLCGGFALAILCGMDWPLRTSAKEIVSVPAYIVIGYECTILFGAIFTLMGIFHFCKLPDIFRHPGYDPRFSDDKFGVVIGCEADEVDSIKDKLLSAGADEVDVRDGL